MMLGPTLIDYTLSSLERNKDLSCYVFYLSVFSSSLPTIRETVKFRALDG